MSSQNEPDAQPQFDFWDWLAIYVCADIATTGIFAILAGAGGFFSLGLAIAVWSLHEWSVRKAVERGDR